MKDNLTHEEKIKRVAEMVKEASTPIRKQVDTGLTPWNHITNNYFWYESYLNNRLKRLRLRFLWRGVIKEWSLTLGSRKIYLEDDNYGVLRTKIEQEY